MSARPPKNAAELRIEVRHLQSRVSKLLDCIRDVQGLLPLLEARALTLSLQADELVERSSPPDAPLHVAYPAKGNH